MPDPRPLLPLLLAALLLGGWTNAVAQDDPPALKITALMHPDGSCTDSSLDFVNNTLDEKTYNAGGVLTRHVIYELDSQRLPKAGAHYNTAGTLLYRFTFTRDPMGRIVEETNHTPEGAFIRRLVYDYHADGRLKTLTAFDPNGQVIPNDQPAIRQQVARPRPARQPNATAQQPEIRRAAPVVRAEPVQRAQPVVRAEPVAAIPTAAQLSQEELAAAAAEEEEAALLTGGQSTAPGGWSVVGQGAQISAQQPTYQQPSQQQPRQPQMNRPRPAGASGGPRIEHRQRSSQATP